MLELSNTDDDFSQLGMGPTIDSFETNSGGLRIRSTRSLIQTLGISVPHMLSRQKYESSKRYAATKSPPQHNTGNELSCM